MIFSQYSLARLKDGAFTCLKPSLLGLAASALVLTAQAAQAQYHLIIDIEDPSAVTITATGQHALFDAPLTEPVSDPDRLYTLSNDGIELEGFFPVNSGDFWGSVTTSTLRANGMSEAAPYNVADNNYTPVTRQDVNLRRGFGTELQAFSTSAPAFYGQMTLNIDPANELGPYADTGEIFNSSWGGAQIGTYLVAKMGDGNLDNKVDFTDFVTLSNNWAQPGDWSTGDFDGDGTNNFADFVLLSNNWGYDGTAPAPAAGEPVAVPEPSSLALLALGGLALARRRRG